MRATLGAIVVSNRGCRRPLAQAVWPKMAPLIWAFVLFVKLISMRPVHRLRAKTALAAGPVSEAAFLEAALGEELLSCDAGLVAESVRTKHVHYTHGRSSDAAQTRPDTMSRKELWEHLVRVYAGAYPCAKSPAKNILVFALLAQERAVGVCASYWIRAVYNVSLGETRTAT